MAHSDYSGLANAQVLSGEALAKALPLKDLSSGAMIFRDGSLSIGFSCTIGMPGLMPSDERRVLFEGFRTALKTLPENATGQLYFGQESRASDIEAKLRCPDHV